MTIKRAMLKRERQLKVRAMLDRVCIVAGVFLIAAFLVEALAAGTFDFVLDFGGGDINHLGFQHILMVAAAIGIVLMLVVWNRAAPFLALLAVLMYLLLADAPATAVFVMAVMAVVGAVFRLIWHMNWPGDAKPGDPVPAWKMDQIRSMGAATRAGAVPIASDDDDDWVHSGIFYGSGDLRADILYGTSHIIDDNPCHDDSIHYDSDI